MNMFKKNGGFTLVELIVVIAILAILAGVAVPVYSGYITKANEAADYTLLDSVKTAAVFAATEQDPTVSLDEIVVTITDAETGAYTVVAYDYGTDGEKAADLTAEGVDDKVFELEVADYVGETLTFKSGKTTATWLAEDAVDAEGEVTAEAGWTLN